MSDLIVDATPMADETEPERVAPTPSFTATRRLVWLVLRRDRFRISMWMIGLVGLMTVSASSIVALYTTPDALEGYARTVRGNSALIIQAGPGYGLDDPTLGAVLMNETAVWMFIAVGVMSVFMVVRHTRTEEETERAELVRAAPVGRHAALASAMIGVLVANTAIAAGSVVAMVAFELPAAGSLAFGASMIGVGMVFAGLSAVIAQIAGATRAALAGGGVMVGAAFVLRAIGDVGSGVLSWASPIGWAQAIRAYADERWWVLLLPLATTTALVFTARALQDRRDYASGFIAPRRGRREATDGLSGALGLAVRLQRGALVGWAIGLAALGFFYGVVADQAEQMLEDNPDMADFFAQLGRGSVTDAFLSTAMLIMALFASGFTVSSVLRLRSEELSGRADPVLAAPVGRRRFASSHLGVAVVGSAILALVCGASMGVGAALVLGDAGRVAELAAAGAVTVPAMWVLAGTTMLVYGLRPRWALASWVFVAWAFVAVTFAGVLDLPQWSTNVSPFQHVPALPAASMAWTPLVVLTASAAALIGAGLVALDRRNMA